MKDWDEKLPSDTGLSCPITGSRLMYTGHETEVRDGLSFYAAESDPKAVKYSRHPFAYNLFYTGNPYYKYSDFAPQRIFRLNDDKTWTEMIKVSGLLFPIDTSNEVIAKTIFEHEEKEAARHAEYERKVASGEITPLPSTKIKITASTIEFEKVEVKPTGPPTGILYYMDFKYGNNNIHKMINEN